jgi:hypothetical protein
MSTRGRAIARLLAGSWRATPPSPPLLSDATLRDCAARLVEGGAAALAWARVRGTALAETATAAQLRNAHRMQTLTASLQRSQLVAALTALSSVGVTPLCAKGWAVARYYREPGLRAACDIDLYVAPADYARAQLVLSCVQGAFDLHRGVPQLADRAFADVVARAERVAVGGSVAHVLSPADHLRLVSLHALAHGAWRPLWLCDVGALVEAGGIDWELCLAGSSRRAGWVTSAVAAARELLGADLWTAPAAVRSARLPTWLTPALLDAWGARYQSRQPIASYWWRPWALPRVLWQRWPNPIEATLDVGAGFDETPRLPLQVAGCLVRIGRFAGAMVSRRLTGPDLEPADLSDRRCGISSDRKN